MKNISFLFAFLVLAGVIGYVYVNMNTAKEQTQNSEPEVEVPLGWEEYKTEDFGFAVAYPQNLAVDTENLGEYSVMIHDPASQTPVGPANFMYISFVPNGKTYEAGTIYNYDMQNFDTLEGTEVGSSVDLSANTGQGDWFTYTRLPDRVIGGRAAKVFENLNPWEFPEGTKEIRLHVARQNINYIIGAYITPGDPFLNEDLFYQILDTAVITPVDITESEKLSGEFTTYSNEDFSIEYQTNMEVRDEGGGPVSFVLIGPTQTEGTELFDGMNLTVITGEHSAEDFRTFVEDQIDQTEDDGVSEIVDGITEYSTEQYEGFQFTTRGLGEFRQIYLEGEENRYAHISLFVEDPTSLGFQNIADTMISSFILK